MDPHDLSGELDDLLIAYADGELTPDQRRRLMALIKDDPSAREAYLEYLLLDSLLAWERPSITREGAGPTVPALRGGPARATWFTGWPRRAAPLLAASCAAVLLTLVAIHAVTRGRGRGQPIAGARAPAGEAGRPSEEPLSGGVAILTRAVDVAWEPSSPTPAVGSILAPGPLRFRTGLVQLEFFRGATVILEGPAEIDLKASDRAYCGRGKLRAFVPTQARGFRIDSPAADLVDRGTEFGLQITPDRGAEVYVFRGAVEVHEAHSGRGPHSKRELTQSQGIRISGTGGVTPMTGAPPTFMTLPELERLDLAELGRHFGEWQVDSRRRRADPRVVAYFPFEDARAGTRTLTDLGPRPGVGGAIVGCAWVDGRWPGKGALEFKRPSDRVRIDVPGTFDSLTLVAWVRVDSLPNSLNALMVSQESSHESNPAEVHWQIRRDGRCWFSVHHASSKTGRPWTVYDSYHLFGPERLGRWTELTVVYDAAAGSVTHYVDGREHRRNAIVDHVPLRIGEAEIGNWTVPPSGDPRPIRNLNGRMDEFIVFDAALTPTEVRELFELGRPQP